VAELFFRLASRSMAASKIATGCRGMTSDTSFDAFITTTCNQSTA
jgi:hypothetical protein